MREFWTRFRKDRLATTGLVVIVVFIVAAIGAPRFAPFDPTEQFFDGLTLEGSPLPPNDRFWFGTDTNGRDQFSRLLYGAQTSLLIGIVANGLAVVVGTAFGLIAGYLRGLVGAAIMRFTDLMMAFPPLLLAIALAAILKPGLQIVILVIALVNWVQIARVIYTETVALSEREYIEAARALGQAPGASCSATCCRICSPPSSSMPRSALPPRCCSRPCSPSSAAACSRQRQPGA